MKATPAIIFRRVRHVAAGVAMMVVSLAAQGNLIVNGDFETGTIAGWTTFTTANGTLGSGLPDVVSFDTSGAGASLSARFQVGESSFAGVGAGGGIFQSIATGAGILSISLDIASDNASQLGNASGGVFTLLLDSVAVDSVDFADINAGSTERDSLSFGGAVGAGSHEIRIQMTRPFQIGSFGQTPFQYIDNVVATAAAVPEPGTLALLGLSLAGLAASRRRKQ